VQSRTQYELKTQEDTAARKGGKTEKHSNKRKEKKTQTKQKERRRKKKEKRVALGDHLKTKLSLLSDRTNI